MQKTGQKGETLKPHNGLTPEYWQAQANRDKVRELADIIGSVVVDEALPVEFIGLVADCLKEDLLQIKQAAADIMEEQRAIEAMWQTTEKEIQERQGGMYGFISGMTETNDISYCPKCGEKISRYRADGTADCDSCGYHFGVVECEDSGGSRKGGI